MSDPELAEQAERAHQADRVTIDILIEQGEDLARQRDVAERALVEAVKNADLWEANANEWQRTCAGLDEEITTLRATLARVEGERDKALKRIETLQTLMQGERLEALAAERDGLREQERAAMDAWKNIALERDGLRAALDEALVSHVNLYKATFGEQAEPKNDMIYRQMLAALGRPVI